MSNKTREVALTEYSASQAGVFHYDQFPWQVGGVLIAGTFVFWGLILSIQDSTWDATLASAGNILLTFLMTIWLGYTVQTRQTYLFKLHRLIELEIEYGMRQHLRFWNQKTFPKGYQLSGCKGYVMNILVYFFVSFGGILLILIREGPSDFLCSELSLWTWFNILLGIGAIIFAVCRSICDKQIIRDHVSELIATREKAMEAAEGT